MARHNDALSSPDIELARFTQRSPSPRRFRPLSPQPEAQRVAVQMHAREHASLIDNKHE
jgi:hypothetical protein